MPRKPSSTSSGQTEPLRDAKAILNLGRKLVRELKLEHTCETLSKWMAHYLAEQMLAVETAKTQKQKAAAQKKCCELIMKIWEQRCSLPNGARPLGRLEDAMKALTAIESQQDEFGTFFTSDRSTSNNPWFTFAEKTYEIEWRLVRIAFLTGMLEQDFGAEKQWVEKHAEVLSENEKKLIGALDSWLGIRSPWLTSRDDKSVGDLPPAQRVDMVLKELDALSQQQRRAFLDLRKRQTRQAKE